MTPAQFIGAIALLAVTFALGYVAGFRSGLAAMPPPRVVPLKPGAKRKASLRATKPGAK